ncbi:MAG: two pore domain potassium channel family protein, partial [Lachnospiraceae bacterium]|nr:two pore domain potassium channel family protein [Lachnospiraceae bacterium]
MNKKTNKALIWTISIIVFYAVLLVLLVVFERAGNPDETVITTFYNAIWYLLVTITTVGYGDMTPM